MHTRKTSCGAATAYSLGREPQEAEHEKTMRFPASIVPPSAARSKQGNERSLRIRHLGLAPQAIGHCHSVAVFTVLQYHSMRRNAQSRGSVFPPFFDVLNAFHLTTRNFKKRERVTEGSTHEGGYRVPMFFHWPNHVPKGKHFGHPVSSRDFYPTFARLAGAAMPDGKQLAGKDIWDDFLAGRSPRKDEMIYALRHRNGFSDVGARRDQWKICRTFQAPWKLFNIEEDIGENHDLSGQHPQRLRDLVSEAEQWSGNHTEPLWFDTLKAGAEWKATGMPRYEATFKID